jgi:hypothetical protein
VCTQTEAQVFRDIEQQLLGQKAIDKDTNTHWTKVMKIASETELSGIGIEA